ncbi:hypothetical protein CBL_05288 [Carabus blaptoides fortunei]
MRATETQPLVWLLVISIARAKGRSSIPGNFTPAARSADLNELVQILVLNLPRNSPIPDVTSLNKTLAHTANYDFLSAVPFLWKLAVYIANECSKSSKVRCDGKTQEERVQGIEERAWRRISGRCDPFRLHTHRGRELYRLLPIKYEIAL